MAEDQWLLKEDGYLNVDALSTNIIYHPNLNVILVFTKSNEVKVLDVNSGVILQSCSISGNNVFLLYVHNNRFKCDKQFNFPMNSDKKIIGNVVIVKLKSIFFGSPIYSR